MPSSDDGAILLWFSILKRIFFSFILQMVLFYAFTAEGKKKYKYFIVVKTVRERDWEGERKRKKKWEWEWRKQGLFMMIGCLLWLGGVDNLYRTMIFIFIVSSLLLFKFNSFIYKHTYKHIYLYTFVLFNIA